MNYRRFLNRSNKALLSILIIVIIILIIVAVKVLLPTKQVDRTSVSIILSPHYSDAVLALGGMMAKDNRPSIVASFFTAKPSDSAVVTENENAMKHFKDVETHNFSYDNQASSTADSDELTTELSEDIQALIVSQSNKTVYVYGPSLFSNSINNADTTLVYNAFLNVARGYPNQNVHFYFYENYPETDQFNKTSVISLKKNLENQTDILLNQVSIPLEKSDLNTKIDGLKAYTSVIQAYTATGMDIASSTRSFSEKRCGDSACEVVYEIQQF